MPKISDTEKDREKREIGDNLRRCREIAGISQHQLADELDVERNVVHRYETGQNDMSLLRAAQISSILHILVDELIPEKYRLKEENAEQSKVNESIDLRSEMLLDRIKELSPEEIDELYKIIDIAVDGLKARHKTA